MRNKIKTERLLGYLFSVLTLIFILYFKSTIQSLKGEEAIKEAHEFFTMYLVFICGLCIVTFYGVLMKNPLLWKSTLWVLMYSVITFMAASGARKPEVGVILLPIMLLSSTIISAYINKQIAVAKEGLSLACVWMITFAIMWFV